MKGQFLSLCRSDPLCWCVAVPAWPLQPPPSMLVSVSADSRGRRPGGDTGHPRQQGGWGQHASCEAPAELRPGPGHEEDNIRRLCVNILTFYRFCRPGTWHPGPTAHTAWANLGPGARLQLVCCHDALCMRSPAVDNTHFLQHSVGNV